MPDQTERRKFPRREALGKIHLSWEGPEGVKRTVVGRCLNISEIGLSVELSEPLELRALVKLQADQYKLLGVGTVRHCERTTKKYIVGLEFVGGLQWRSE